MTPYVVAGRGWMGLAEEVPSFPALRRFRQSRISPGLRRRLDEQIAWTMECLALVWPETRRPYVAFSGGKDSSVLLHLAASVRPEIEGLLLLEREGAQASVHQAAAYWREQGRPVIEYVWGSLLNSIQERGAPILPLRSITQWAKEQGFDGCLRGLRAEESKGRTAHANTHAPVRDCGGYWVADPIIWWSVDDVWAYLALHGLPYAEEYDREDGQPRHLRRIGTPWGMIGAEQGRIVRLKRFDRARFAEFSRAVPDVRRYT